MSRPDPVGICPCVTEGRGFDGLAVGERMSAEFNGCGIDSLPGMRAVGFGRGQSHHRVQILHIFAVAARKRRRCGRIIVRPSPRRIGINMEHRRIGRIARDRGQFAGIFGFAITPSRENVSLPIIILGGGVAGVHGCFIVFVNSRIQLLVVLVQPSHGVGVDRLRERCRVGHRARG